MIAFQEAVGRRLLDLELEAQQDVLLHLENLLLGVGVFGQGDEVFH